MTAGTALLLAGNVLVLSLLQFGGTLAVAPDLHRLVVTRLGLLGDAQFTASVALAQSAPGPNVLYVAVVGYQVAGVAGAAALLAAILLPSSTLVLAVGRWGAARPGWRPLRAFRAGMAPITIALLCATSWVLVADAPAWRPALLAAAVAALVWRTRVHILWLIAAGAVLGALGAV